MHAGAQAAIVEGIMVLWYISTNSVFCGFAKFLSQVKVRELILRDEAKQYIPLQKRTTDIVRGMVQANHSIKYATCTCLLTTVPLKHSLLGFSTVVDTQTPDPTGYKERH